MNWKVQLSILLIACGASYAGGRYLSPTKTISVVDTTTKTDMEKHTDKNTVVEIHEHKNTDGSVDKDTTITNKDKVDLSKDSQTQSHSETVTSTEKPQWGAGISYNLYPRSAYGLTIERRILGPVFVGVRGQVDSDLSNRQLGATLRVEF